MAKKIVFLDSCAIFPQSLRDVLMQFSVDGLFQAKWSKKVEAELVKNVEAKFPQHKGKLQNTVDKMRRAIPDFESDPSAETIASVSASKTDIKDVEILAAAIETSCTHLVTYNLKDFDISFASAKAVAVIHPDEFLCLIIDSDKSQCKLSFESAVRRTQKPARNYQEYCEGLKKNSLTKSADLLLSLLEY